MSELGRIIASHPLRQRPYDAIRYTRPNGHSVPLYQVNEEEPELGAREALKRAFELHGAECFHCKTWLPAQKLSQQCNRDHVRPKARGGRHYLHNLVVTCGDCNRKKGGRDIIAFSTERGSEYLEALETHLAHCIETLTRG